MSREDIDNLTFNSPFYLDQIPVTNLTIIHVELCVRNFLEVLLHSESF